MYYLKHISEGVMPEKKGGHTWSEPEYGAIPRIFRSEKSARLSLQIWTKGQMYADNGTVRLNPTPDRNKNDWEIRRVIFQ